MMIGSLSFRFALTAACILAIVTPHPMADRGEHNYFRSGGNRNGGNYGGGGGGGDGGGGDYGYNVAFQNVSCSSNSCPLDWGGLHYA